MTEVPTIDVGPLTEHAAFFRSPPTEQVATEIAQAAERFGFFQVVGHGVPTELVEKVWQHTRSFFDQSRSAKRALLRTKDNSRGYYDRELTKQARDLKEVLDIAHVPFPELADDHPDNYHRVDGVNQWPGLNGFRATMIDYLGECERVCRLLLGAFLMAMAERDDQLLQHFGSDHTSFLRLNYYPLTDPLDSAEAAEITPLGDMALHHHSDSGALTLLLQDAIGGLQVEHGGDWLDVEPRSDAFVVNTGDMMQVWSNDRFRAALHRVAPRTNAARYSLPYFYNPSYDTDYEPRPGTVAAGGAHYRTINWGDFRQARADGDFADYGSEIQIADYRNVSPAS